MPMPRTIEGPLPQVDQASGNDLQRSGLPAQGWLSDMLQKIIE